MQMAAVVIGVDPAKRSHAVEVVDDHERTLATLQVVNDNDGYRRLRVLAPQWWFRSEALSLPVTADEVVTVCCHRPSGFAGFARFALHPLSSLTVRRR
jgi:hypothetical protein